MSIKYDSRRETLAEIIKNATINATYVIPDLQRPFVWSPRQVTMLVDSLFRGWPFGSLLLWEVKPDCFSANEGIPHRPFWQIVDRTENDNGSQNSVLGHPATYQMVLDGQQRVQSLILALGGDQWGFQLLDSEWALDLQDRRVRASKHWSKASMCIDLLKFKAELKDKNDIVRKIEVGKILEWAILDPVAGQSLEPRPANYVYPLEKSKDNPGRFIRLSRFWDIAQQGLSEREYKKLLDVMLKEHGVNDSDRENLLDPLAEFMKVVETVKLTSFVHALQIDSFEMTPEWSKDDYSDAIVNIFTRLNTAGRTLTREEITLAWLKVGWLPEHADNKTAGKCLDELRSTLSDKGFNLEIDEIVRLISFVWAVEYRNGLLLDSKDLLKGEIVRSMAASVAAAWIIFKSRVEDGANIINKRDLIESQGSFNAIIVYLTWYRLVFDRFDIVASSILVPERDSLEKMLVQVASQFLDRWVFGSQWANLWGDNAALNFQNSATDLHEIYNKLKVAEASELFDAVNESIDKMMNRVSVKAIENIKIVLVRDRKRVHAYYSFLWVWHRLDSDRWENSSIQMRTGRKRTSKLEVDHTVADAWWVRSVEKITQEKLENFIGSDEDRALVAPDGFESLSDAIAFINFLGNCSLLEKSFNISKSDKSMRSFLSDVHEFKNRNVIITEWENALALTSTLTSPEESDLLGIMESVKERDALIRKDLIEFIEGRKVRTDL